MTSEPAPDVSRRTFMKTVGVAAFAGVATGIQFPRYPYGPAEVFDFGVSSTLGIEPWHSVVLKARVDPTLYTGTAEAAWYVSYDPDGREMVAHPSAQGQVPISAFDDFQVATTVEGLEPGRAYYYRFELLIDGKPQASSEVARTKTAPAPWLPLAPLRIAVASCQNYSHGYFHAMDAIARDDTIDLVAHLGDYVYSDVDDRIAAILLGYPRQDLTGVATDLAGYRLKYRMYRSDPMLRRAHAAHPWIVTWDDHELVNNYEAGQGGSSRIAAAQRAWWEAMPLARFAKHPNQLWRGIPWGRDLQISLTDSRTHRRGDDIWGKEQRDWFMHPTERQTVLLNSTVIPRAARVDELAPQGIVVTGDNHIQGATTMHHDGARVGLDVMCGAVSSRAGSADLSDRMEHVLHDTRGYTVLDIHPHEGVEITFVAGDVERAHPRNAMAPRLTLTADWNDWALRTGKTSQPEPAREVLGVDLSPGG